MRSTGCTYATGEEGVAVTASARQRRGGSSGTKARFAADADRVQSALADYQYRMTAESFTGTDELGTVEATVNGECRLIGLHLEDGLLRLGAEVVEQRIGEALQNAHAVADAAADTEHEQLFEAIGLTSDVIAKFDSAISEINHASD